MDYTSEIKETLTKINDFIQSNNNINYKIRLLEREVPNLQELVKKLTITDVSDSFFCDAKLVNGISNCKKQCEGCLKCLHTPKK